MARTAIPCTKCGGSHYPGTGRQTACTTTGRAPTNNGHTRYSKPAVVGPETFSAHKCSDCEQIVEEGRLSRIYECGSCGTRTDERKCPDCNKFAARAEEDGCPDCFAECEEVEAVVDIDGEIIEADQYDPDRSFAEREAEETANQKITQATRRTERHEAVKASADPKPWTAVTPGMRVVLPDTDPDDPVGSSASEVLHVAHRSDGAVIVAARGTYPPVKVYSGDEPVLVAETGEPPSVGYGTVTRNDAEKSSGGSPVRGMEVAFGYDRDMKLPVLEMSTSMGMSSSPLSAWYDPQLATEALDEMERAARALCAEQGVAYNETDTDGRVEQGERVYSGSYGGATYGIGPDLFGEGVEITYSSANNHTSSISDGNMLGSAVRAARSKLGALTMTPR